MMQNIIIDNQTLFLLSLFHMAFLLLINIGYVISYPKAIGIRFYVLGNLTYLIFFILVYIDASNGILTKSVVIGLLDVLTVAFWCFGIKHLMKVSLNIKFTAIILTLNLLHTLFYQYVQLNLNYQRGFTALFTAILLYECAYRLKIKRKSLQLKSFYFVSLSMIIFASFKLIMAAYRTIIHTETMNVFEVDMSISIFVFVSLLFAVLMNFAISFLNHDILRSDVVALSFLDGLTNIANRRKFNEEYKKLYAQYQRRQLMVGISMIDIDDFKIVNDTYGHDIGDIALVELAKFFTTNLRTGDIVARFGGEEFIIAIIGESDNEIIQSFDRILFNYQKSPVIIEEHTITYSGGVSLITEASSLRELIKLADKRMYCSKKKGKNQMTYPESLD